MQAMLHQLRAALEGAGTTLMQERSEGAAFLRMARTVYSLSHLGYISINIRIGRAGTRYMHCMYTNDRLRQYVTQKAISPEEIKKLQVVLAGKDHADSRANIDVINNEKYEIHSIPLACSLGEMAALILIGNFQVAEWVAYKQDRLKECAVLGNYFHQHMLRIAGQAADRQMLISARELDCLKWMAVGKTAWEASVILGITERTVRFHLNAAREKLNCTTTTQAVAQAVARQLISV